jgi:hypothetical protein
MRRPTKKILHSQKEVREMDGAKIALFVTTFLGN